MFLGPGLALFLALSLDQPQFVRRPLLSSASLSILGIVPALAAFAHGLLIVLFVANSWIADKLVIVPWPVDPNPYPTYVKMVRGEPVGISSIAWALLCISGTVGLTGLATTGGLRLLRLINTKKYGDDTRWPGEPMLAFLTRFSASEESRALIATVFVRDSINSSAGGWVGIVDEVRVDHVGALVSISLIEPSYFDVDEWKPSGAPTESKYREHDWPNKYSSITIFASEVRSLAYFVSEPPDGANSGSAETDLTNFSN